MAKTDLEKLLAAIPATGAGPLSTAHTTTTAASLLDVAAIAPAANAPGRAGGGSELVDELGRLAAQLEQLRQATSTQVDSLNQNTDAVIQNASSKSGS